MILGIHPLLHHIIKRKNPDLGLQDLDLSFEFENIFGPFPWLMQKLEDRNLDFLILPLHLIPLQRNKNFKIWALAERTNDRTALISRKTKLVTSAIPVEPESEVGCFSQILACFLEQIRSDLNFKIGNSIEIIEMLENEEINHVIVPSVFVSEELRALYHVKEFNSREIIPPPGMGGIAIIGLHAHEYGPIVRKIHHKLTGYLCNIERKTVLIYGSDIHAHSEKDVEGNFHLWVGSIKDQKTLIAHVSQSTRINLIERALEKIN